MSPTVSGPMAGVELERLFLDYINRLERRQRQQQTVVNFVSAAKPFQVWLTAQGMKAADVTEDGLWPGLLGNHQAFLLSRHQAPARRADSGDLPVWAQARCDRN